MKHSKITVYKKENNQIRERTILNADIEYYDQYVVITTEEGQQQVVKNFENIIVK